MKRLWINGLIVVTLLVAMASTAAANSDRGPNKQLTIADAVTLIVEKFELSLAHMQFAKAPVASDYFTSIADDAPYADAFVIAHLNGLPLDRDVQPNGKITREQFAHLVQHAIDSKGDFAYILLYVVMEDEDKINPDYMGSIQKMVISGIMSLDKSNRFQPERPVYRYYALDVIDKALKFVEERIGATIGPVEEEDVRVKVDPVTDEVNKVTVSHVVPHPGYGLAIERIEFTADQKAIIYYTVLDPAPDMMYPQVISEAYAVTYVSSEYEPVAKPAS